MGTANQKKPQVTEFFSRYWWLFLIPSVLVFYMFLSFVLVSMGEAVEVSDRDNLFYDAAVAISPWNADALAGYAKYKRNYAVSVEGEERQAALEEAVTYFERAIRQRPYWPYYVVGALDAEYIMGAPEAIIQQRFDDVVQLAPNERGLDHHFTQLAILNWLKLRDDQKAWAGKRLLSVKSPARQAAVDVIKILPDFQRGPLCAQLPWSLAKDACN